MELTTASAVINFAMELEDRSVKFYEELARRYRENRENRETFLSFVKENKKNKVLIKRVYNEVISDALEACFSFEGLNTDDYLIEIELAEGTSYPDALRKALDIEEKIQKSYLDVAEKSKSLLADVPRAFERIAKKRNERRSKLKSLYNKL